jgi:hypothetical protein
MIRPIHDRPDRTHRWGDGYQVRPAHYVPPARQPLSHPPQPDNVTGRLAITTMCVWALFGFYFEESSIAIAIKGEQVGSR